MTPAGVPRRGAVLALWLLALALGVGLIARTPIATDLSAFLPASPNAQQRVLIEQLQSGVAARTLLVGIDGGDAAGRAEASRKLAAALRASGLFEQVQNGERGDDLAAAGRWLAEHRYRLSPAVAPERYTEKGLRDAIDETLALLGTPAGAAVKPLLARDPTGETARIAEVLLPRSAPRSEQGVWMSRSRPRALLLLTTRAAGADLDGQARTIAAVRSAFASVGAPALDLKLSGSGVFSVDSRAQIEREVKLLAAVGSLVMGALLLLAFASLRALAVALLPVVSGIVAGVAAVGTLFGTVHGVTLGFGSTLIGEAVDYAIYYLIQARRTAAAPGEGWRHWLRENWPTVRLGLLTSVCGFAALAFSGFPGLAQLGVFSVAGLTGAALVTRYVLPVLVPDGASGRGLRGPLGQLAAQGVRVLPRLRWPALLLGLLAAGWLALQGGSIWRGDLLSLSPVPRAALALDAELRAELGTGDTGLLVVANGADLQDALRHAEAAGARLDALVEHGRLLGVDSPTRLLPSLATQQQRIASLPPRAVLQERLAAATAGGPLPAARLSAFLDDVDAARTQPPITRESLAGTPFATLVDALVVPRRAGGVAVLMSLQPAAGVDAAAVRTALEGAAPGLQVIDIGGELASMYRGYLHEAVVQVALGALAVLVLLAAWLRSPRRLLAVCQPLVIAVLLVLAGLSLAGVALGILHLVGLLLVVAVGSNYTLFFDQLRHQHGRIDDDTLASLLLANLTTVISFGLIALSEIPALSAIGRVVAPGALLCLLLAASFARREAAAPA